MVERRRNQRFSFEAPIELIRERSHDRIAAISTDIGLTGCFVKTTVYFPEDTVFRIRIVAQGSSLTANGRVVYSRAGQGMGLRFQNLKTKDRGVLARWIAEQKSMAILSRR